MPNQEEFEQVYLIYMATRYACWTAFSLLMIGLGLAWRQRIKSGKTPPLMKRVVAVLAALFVATLIAAKLAPDSYCSIPRKGIEKLCFHTCPIVGVCN